MFRRFAVRSLATLFGTCALLFATLIAFNAVFGTPEPLKQALDSSHVYDALGSSLTSSGGPNGQQLADTPEVQQATKQAVDSKTAKKTIEQFVDGTYHWLNGKTAQPDFRIDLTGPVNTFKQSLTSLAEAKLQALPPCTEEQLQNIDINTITYDSLPCLPPGIDIHQLAQQSVDNTAVNNTFLQNPIVTADTLPKDKAGKNAFQRAYAAPAAFQVVKDMTPFVGILALVAAGLIFWLRKDWLASLKIIGVSLVIDGVFLVAGGFLVDLAFSLLHKQEAAFSTGATRAISEMIGTLAHDITKFLYSFGSLYLLLAIAGLVAVHIIRKQRAALVATAVTDEETAAKPAVTRKR